MLEVWTNIPGYTGLYIISTLGNIKNKRGNLIKFYIDNHGYKIATLSKNDKKKYIRVHRLVAISFILNPENKPFVNHIDGDRSNNKLDNLEWCTPIENVTHSIKIGNRGSKEVTALNVIDKILEQNDITSVSELRDCIKERIQYDN